VTRQNPVVMTRAAFLFAMLGAAAVAAGASPVTYKIDSDHTYPSFEADHMGGLSVWRGKMNRTTGTVVLDKAAGSGSVDVTIDLGSIDFGQRQLDHWAVGPQFFDAQQYASANYRGRLEGFADGKPTQVVGELSMRGITRPLTLEILSFKCVPHPLFKRDLCGADAQGRFNREEFGLSYGKQFGFGMDVLLRIQVEALATQ
jgi:polyisoprenoid-binding protein YceI